VLKNRFRKILVALDGSPNSIRALNEAISLARQCDSRLIGLFVISTTPILQEKFKTFRNYQLKRAKNILEKAKVNAAKNGIEFKGEILYDKNIQHTISKFAQFKKCNVIVMGFRGDNDPKEKFLGSKSHGVVNISKIPVLVVK